MLDLAIFSSQESPSMPLIALQLETGNTLCIFPSNYMEWYSSPLSFRLLRSLAILNVSLMRAHLRTDFTTAIQSRNETTQKSNA